MLAKFDTRVWKIFYNFCINNLRKNVEFTKTGGETIRDNSDPRLSQRIEIFLVMLQNEMEIIFQKLCS